MEKLVISLLGLFVFSCLTLSVSGECTLASDCITDIKPEDCEGTDFITANEAIDGCCPSCKTYPNITTDFCGVNIPCPPGTFCNESRICQLDLDSCYHSYHLPADRAPIYPPACNLDGTYAAVQCKGDDLVGRCFCSDEKGKRIYGISWAPDAMNMTCGCSRRRSELEKSGRTDVTLHCLPNGNYEPLQCESELCWCADEKTGNPITSVVPENLVSQLPCFDEETFGSQYLRMCESKAYGIAVMKNVLIHHGTTQVTMETLLCDWDGTYGVYQIDKGIAYCSWKDGSRIGSWQTEAGAILNTVTCNCARDTKYYEEVGKILTLTCSGEGNYAARQQINGQYYCVDRDGFPVTELKPLGEELDCSEYI